ncbi:MAG: M48 family metallopeptidase [Solirubrobacteraceae bacterium]
MRAPLLPSESPTGGGNSPAQCCDPPPGRPGGPSPGGDTLTYLLRHSDRARRVRVRVTRDGGVEVVVPARMSPAATELALSQLRGWIDRRLAEVSRQRAAVLARGDTLPYLGRSLTVVAQAGRERVALHGATLLVPDGLTRDAALERWYRRQARSELAGRVQHACQAVGVTHSRLTIRDQRTRWGSASPNGALSFNWRLLLAPEEVLDYVVWHEVCHLAVMDHSARFWALVARYCPDHRQHAAWLRKHDAMLVL